MYSVSDFMSFDRRDNFGGVTYYYNNTGAIGRMYISDSSTVIDFFAVGNGNFVIPTKIEGLR